MAGCGNQSASSESAPAESTAESTEATTDTASADAEQSQDEIIAELKAAVANPFAYKSVTINETVNPLTKGDEEAAGDEAVSSKGVYKFDASGDKLRTSMEATVSDVTLTYYTEGDDAVVVTDGPVYSGTTEELGLSHFDGVEAYMTDSFGDLQSIVDCVDTVTKEQQGDVTVYTLTVDPQNHIASDEILSMMADYGDPLQSATFIFGFDQDGRMVSLRKRRNTRRSLRSVP